MAAPGRTHDSDIAEAPSELRLRKEPFSFEFFQAVRLLERFAAQRQPVGRFTHPSREVARFCTHASLAFPASAIQALNWPEGEPPKMVVNFMGMTGPSGVLPLYYTELVCERLRARDSTLRDFLDMFNHRMISLFYQAWEKYRFMVAYERGERDRFTRHLLALIGLGTPGLQERQAVADDALLYYSGLLSRKARPAAALRAMLSDYFDVPVEIIQFVGAWRRLGADAQCSMQDARHESERLGIGAVVGDEIWDQQSRVRIRLGPLSLSQYLDFLPNGTAYEPLRALTRFFANDEFDFEVQLALKQEEVPRCELGAEGESAPQLGWVTWLKSAPLAANPADTILQL